MKSMYKNYLKTGAVLWAACFVGLFMFYLIVLGPQDRLRRQTEAKLTDVAARAQAAMEAAQEKNKARLAQQLQEAIASLGRFARARGSTDNLTLDVRAVPGGNELPKFGVSAGGSEAVIKMANCKQITGRRVTVTFASSFNMFAAFLNSLERNEPVFIVDTFTITRSREETAPHKVDMSLAVLVDEAGARRAGG
jgi:post-segregation antitoxin (ccd killing protein)